MSVERVISTDGTPIGFRTGGSGPPLVMVHGGMADHTALAPLVPLLEPHFTVVAVDRRGRGASGDGVGYAVEREFADIATVVETVAARTGGQVHLYGHSYGATCALGASLLTTCIARLALYEPAFAGVFAYPPGWLDRLDALVTAGAAADALALALQERAGASASQIDAMRALPSWARRVAAARALPRELRVDQSLPFIARGYAGMRTPTLLLLGELSPAGQRGVVRAIHAALLESEIGLLEGQEHMAQVVAPQLVAAELIRFLSPATAAQTREPVTALGPAPSSAVR